MKTEILLKYGQYGSSLLAHKFWCTHEGITYKYLLPSIKNPEGVMYFYISRGVTEYRVPDISALTEEELFQYSLVWDVPFGDVFLNHQLQVHVLRNFHSRTYRKTHVEVQF